MHPTIRRILTGKYFLFSFGALLLYTLIGFFLLPLTIGWYVPKMARDQLNCKAGLGKVRINPFLMSVEVTGFGLAGPDGEPLAGFERLFVDLEPSGIFNLTVRFSEFRIEKPRLQVVVAADGETNFAKLIPKSTTSQPKPASLADPMRLLLKTVAIAGGEVTVTDRRQSIPATLQFQELTLKANDLSTIRNQNGRFFFSTTTRNGETFQSQGEIGFTPFRSVGRLEFRNIQAATLWGFVRDTLRLESPDGKLDVSSEYRIDTGVTPLQLALENFRLGLSGNSLKMTETDGPFFELSRLDVDSVRFDLAGKSIQVGKILVDGGLLSVHVDDRGASNLEKIRAKVPGEEKKEEASVSPVALEGPAPAPGTASLEPRASSPGPAQWTVDLEAIEVKNIGVNLEDMSRVLPLSARVKSLSVSSKVRIEAGFGTAKVLVQQLGVELKEVRLGNKGAPEPIFSANRFFIEGGDVDLSAGALTISRMGLSDGRIGIHRDEGGLMDLEQLFSARSVKPPSPDADVASPPWKITVPVIEIKDMAFGFEDLSTVAPASAGVSGISISSGVEILTGSGIEGGLKGFSAELNGLRLGNRGGKEPGFEAGRFFVKEGDIDLGARTITITGVGLNDGRLDMGRERDGKLNLVKLFTPKIPASGDRETRKVEAASAPAWKYLVKRFELDGFRSALSDDTGHTEKPLYQLQGLRVLATDIDGRSPMGVELGFNATQGGVVKLKGRVDPVTPSVDATINITDFSLSPLQPYLEPFITLTLQSAFVSTEGSFRYGVPQSGSRIVYDGSFSLDKLSLSEPGSKETYLGWTALRIPRVKLNIEPNNLQIEEVRLIKPLGQLIIAEDRTVNLAKIVKEQPEKTSPSPPVKTEPGKKEAPAGQAAGKDPFPFHIGTLRVEDGNMVFADLSLKPKFMTRIHSLKGMVSGLSSSENSLAQIQLDGGVDQYGFVKVTGALDLRDIKRSTEIGMVFQNVELTSVTPYSGKFAGRGIKSGKLSLNLDYKIQNNRMLGDNKIIVDNLELGAHVDSPEAVNLPLDLAVALMKDANGKIDIGLPVSGDLNDPRFSLGPLIWKAFVNLITKAITAPFRALGSLFGGAEETFDAVVFDSGKAELTPPEKEKLKKLSEALQKRPQLGLIVQGRYSPEADGLEFKKSRVRLAVGALTGEKFSTGEDSVPLDPGEGKTRRALEKIFEARFGAPALAELNRGVKEGTLKARPMEALMPGKGESKKQNRFWKILQGAKLYKLVPGAKSPEQSELLATELYARMVESEPVPEQELVRLAATRAESVGAELEKICNVPLSRIKIKEPEAQANDEGRSVKLSLDALVSQP
ncbi:MAG: DUF748 domain-containing protein [Pseudomonadota bacterium]